MEQTGREIFFRADPDADDTSLQSSKSREEI